MLRTRIGPEKRRYQTASSAGLRDDHPGRAATGTAANYRAAGRVPVGCAGRERHVGRDLWGGSAGGVGREMCR